MFVEKNLVDLLGDGGGKGWGRGGEGEGKHGGRILGGRGASRKTQKKYLLYKLLNLISEGIFTLGRDGKVKSLLSDRFDIVVQVNKVCRGLKVDFAMVGIHFALFFGGVLLYVWIRGLLMVNGDELGPLFFFVCFVKVQTLSVCMALFASLDLMNAASLTLAGRHVGRDLRLSVKSISYYP